MKMIVELYHTHKKSILLFLTVGTLSAIVNFVSFTLLWKIMDYRIAVSIAYVLSVIVHFSANRNLTFNSRDTNMLQQLPRYLTTIILNYFITLSVVHVVVETFNQSPYLGIFCSIGATVGVSYTLLRFWVFREKRCDTL